MARYWVKVEQTAQIERWTIGPAGIPQSAFDYEILHFGDFELTGGWIQSQSRVAWAGVSAGDYVNDILFLQHKTLDYFRNGERPALTETEGTPFSLTVSSNYGGYLSTHTFDGYNYYWIEQYKILESVFDERNNIIDLNNVDVSRFDLVQSTINPNLFEFDTLAFGAGAGDDSVTLPNSLEQWSLIDRHGREFARTGRFHGEDGNDTIKGSSLADIIHGDGGNDVLDGGVGASSSDPSARFDMLFGDDGADTLIAGSGGNALEGGRGSDLFDFTVHGLPKGAGENDQLIFGDYRANRYVDDGSVDPSTSKRYDDIIKLPGSADDYRFVEFISMPERGLSGTAISTIKGNSSGLDDALLKVSGVERVEFERAVDNQVSTGNILLEMLRLANESYGPQPTLSHGFEPLANASNARPEWSGNVTAQAVGRNWHPVSALELGMDAASDDTQRLAYSFTSGHYQAHNSDQRLFSDIPEANALILTGKVGDKVTLAIAFRGTDQIADFADYKDFSDHYAKFKPLIEAINDYVADRENEIEQVLVSGHSLGAGMVQEFMAEHADKNGVSYKALTIGSPGSDNSFGVADSRIMNFIHTDDPVAALAPWASGTSPDAIALKAIALNITFGLSLLPNGLSLENGLKVGNLILNADEKGRQGGEVLINSDVASSKLLMDEHSRDLYFENFAKLLTFAKDEPSSVFGQTSFAQSLREGTIYKGETIQIAPGDSGADFIRMEGGDDYVLGSAGNDTVAFYSVNDLSPGERIGKHHIDAGKDVDQLVLSGFRGDFTWTNDLKGNGSIQSKLLPSWEAKFTGLEKLVFTRFWLSDDETVISGSKLMADADSLDDTGDVLTVSLAATASAPVFESPVVYLDGTPVKVQTVASGQAKVQVDASFDYTDAGDGKLYVSGTNGGDIIVYGAGDKSIESLNGNDIIISRAVASTRASIEIRPGGGDDIVAGGPDKEIIAYGTPITVYNIERQSDGSIRVTDLRSGSPNGTDTLTNIDGFRFVNTTYTVDEALAAAAGNGGDGGGGGGVPTNVAPVAVADKATVASGKVLTLSGSTLVANDKDADGDTLKVVGVGSAQNGTVAYNPQTDQVTFTPTAGYKGPALFTYILSDGRGGTAEGQVAVTVQPPAPNKLPVVTTTSLKATGHEDAPLSGTFLAKDADGDALTFALKKAVPGLTLEADGRFVFDPQAAGYNTLAAGAKASVPVQFTVTDTSGKPVLATATLSIEGRNDAPVAVDDTAKLQLAAGKPLTLTTTSLLTNDTDVDKGDTRTFVGISTGPEHGTLTLKGAVLTYVPTQALANGTSLTDTFEYQVRDKNGLLDTASVTLTVKGVNTVPVASTPTEPFAGREGAPITGQLTFVDPDPADAGAHVFKLAKAIAGLTLNPDGSFVYTPPGTLADGQSAKVTFQYTVSDGTAVSKPATATILVTGANDAPVAGDDTVAYAGRGGATLTLSTAKLVANDKDADAGDVRSFVSVDGTDLAFGAINVSGKSLMYKPDAAVTKIGTGTSLTDQFSYTVSDKSGVQDTANVTIELKGAASGATAALKLGQGANIVTIDVDALANVTKTLAASRIAVVSNFAGGDDTLVLVNGADAFQSTDPASYGGLTTLGAMANRAAQLLDAGRTTTAFELGGSTYLYVDRNNSDMFDAGDGLIQIAGTTGFTYGEELIGV